MKKIFTLLLLAASITAFGQTTYTWKGGTSSAYGTTTNWNPERTSPASNDILVFDMGNIDGASTANSITVSGVTNETIGQLQVIRATGAATGVKTVTFSGTATTLTVTGDLVIGFYASGTYCKIADGGNTINVGGNLTTVNAISASSTIQTGSGKIVFTGATPTLASGSTSGNIGFQNLEVSASTNLTLGGAFQINGDLNINTGGTVSTNGKTIILNATTGVGGTIQGGGTFTSTSGSIYYIQGTGAASGTQTVGTINFNTSSAANSSINSLNITRPNAVTTIGATNAGILNISGGITLTAGTINDGGNTLKLSGGTAITVGATGGTGVHTGTGKIQLNRTNTSPVLMIATASTLKTVSLGNIEVFNSAASNLYSIESGNILTITGTLTLTKSGSGINASGATLIFQNADVPVAKTAGSITTDASTNLVFGTASNTGGAAFTLPDGLFTTTPSINNFTINRDNTLTLGNQGITVNNALTLTKGNLSLAASDLTIGASGAISGGSSSSYIVTDGAGKLTKTVTASIDKTFPIGTANSYDPAIVNSDATVAISAKVSSTLSGSATPGTAYNTKEWSITAASGTPTATLTLSPATATYTTSPLIGSYNGSIYNDVVAVLTGSSNPYTYAASVALGASSKFTTGGSDTPTAIAKTISGSNIHGGKNEIVIENAEGKTVILYTLTGAKLSSIVINAAKQSIAIEKGIYIVSIDKTKSKVLVK
jgi:hypothetical protein